MTRWTRGAGLTALLIAVPTAAWAVGGESHSGPNWVELGSAMFNFCVYIALLVWLGRKPIAEFYDTRRSAVLASAGGALLAGGAVPRGRAAPPIPGPTRAGAGARIRQNPVFSEAKVRNSLRM